MNIIQSGTKFDIYGNGISQHKKLPQGVYEVKFNPQMGYSLEKIEDLRVDFKIYGKQVDRRLNKLLNVYSKSNKNVGAILSGQKGGGKTLFCKRLSQLLNEKHDIPTIIVKGFTPGLDGYLNSITQKCMVLFDEFEKNFDKDEQESILSYFDGLQASVPKLNVVTINEPSLMSEYLFNRTGRFRYLFDYDYPTEEELIEYIKDKSKMFNIERQTTEKLINLITTNKLTYDSLDTIFEDLYYGSTLEDTLLDINVTFNSPKKYNIEVELENEQKISFVEAFQVSFYDNLDISDYDDDGYRLDSLSRSLLSEYKDEENQEPVERLAIISESVPKLKKIETGKYLCQDLSNIKFLFQNGNFDNVDVKEKPTAIYFTEVAPRTKYIPQL